MLNANTFNVSVYEIINVLHQLCRLWKCELEWSSVQIHLTALLEQAPITHLHIEGCPMTETLPNKPYYARGNGLFSLLLKPEYRLQNLVLRRNKINSADIYPFSQALTLNRNLQVLDLYENEIGSEGARHLADALKINQNLRSLSLGNNHIYDEGAQYLAKCFFKYPLTADDLALRKQITAAEAKREEEASINYIDYMYS